MTIEHKDLKRLQKSVSVVVIEVTLVQLILLGRLLVVAIRHVHANWPVQEPMTRSLHAYHILESTLSRIFLFLETVFPGKNTVSVVDRLGSI